MKTRKLFARLSAFALTLLLCVQSAAPALAAGDTVYIRTAEDLVSLAKNCALDSWSQGKTVALTTNISLASVDFLPIPSFGGTFEGRGHTISGLNLTGKLSPAGLFGVLQEGAVVRDLRVSGSVMPAGDGGRTGGVAGENRGLITGCSFSGTVTGKEQVGGIAGLNALTGRIEDCAVTGGVTGSSMTGGVVGENQGVAASCQNQSYVNITSVDPGIDLSDMELSAQLLTLRSLEAVNIATDTGGVAGYSTGMILSCVNEGLVGYQHIGYNVGGIAGRSSGFISGCVNRGQAFGRKDIGGIVGQAEPYIVLNLTEDTLATVQSQLQELERLVDQAAADAQSLSADLSGDFNAINDALDAASNHAQTLGDRLSGYGGDVVSEVDRGSDILADALDRLDRVADTADGLSRKITDGLNTLRQAARELSAAGNCTDETARELDAAADNLSDANDVLSAGTKTLEDGLKMLGDAVKDKDWTGAGGILRTTVQNALDILRNGTGAKPGVTASMNAAVKHLQSALDSVGDASDQAQGALDTLADAIDYLSKASRQGERVFDDAQDLIDFLAEADPIQIARPDEVIGTASDDLFDALSLLGNRLDGLNAAAGSSVDRLSADARAINRQFSALMDTLIDAAYDLEDADAGDKFSDTSETDIEAVTSGKIRACTNEAEVSGDLCVGGIAGSMAVEYELDPEDDALSADAPAYRRAYELKAIVQGSVNTGAIHGRRDYVGCICGRVSLGLVTACEGYGAADSESGDYVGGVAGFSTGAVRSCWTKCTLSGGKYVGGVVGSAGVKGGGDGGVVTRCRSFVRIPACEQYAGAVSGVDRGSFLDNLFVSDDLAGIGRISLSGAAEPVSYAALMGEEGVPEEFRQLTLRFLADGKEVKTVPFQYGGSFDESVFPEAPEREGEFAQWDVDDLTDLRFDTDVTAVYTPCLTAIPSAEKRSDGRPVLFVEGRFDGGDALALHLSDRESPARSTPASIRRTVELWELTVPEDGLSTHTVRYLSPNGSPEGLEVYSLGEAGWAKLPTESVGSYLVFDAEGAKPMMAVVSQSSIWWIWLLAAAAIAALAFLGLALIKRLKKGGKKPVEKKAAPDPKKRRLRILTAACGVLVCLLAAFACFALSGGLDSAAAANVVYQYARQDAFAMDLSAQADVGVRRLSAGTELYRLQSDGRGVTVARQFGAAAYYSDGVVYLENGAAFRLGDSGFLDYATLLGTVKALYQAGDIEVFKNGSEKIYSLRVEKEEAQTLLHSLFPATGGAAEELAALDALDVDLTARSGKFAELRFTADGVLTDGSPASLSAVLTARSEWEAPEIPSAVREAINAGGADAEENTADLLRLLRAWGALNLTDPLSVQMTLSADCGPLVLNDDLELFRTWVDGRQAGCVRKAGQSLYYSGGKFYTEGGVSINTGITGDALSQTQLLELAYSLCLQGEADCAERNGAYLYNLRLGAEDIAEIAGDILPDIRALDVAFQDGVLEVWVKDDAIESVRFSCGGTLRVLFTDAQAHLSCELGFAPTDFRIPEDVAEAMRKDF